MAKKHSELFDRLRQAGLRKEVAKTLSRTGEGAGKKAERTARAAATELRALADEIERRLPADGPSAEPSADKAAPTSRSRRVPAHTTRSAATPRKRATPAKPRAPRSSAEPGGGSTSPAQPASDVGASDGENPTTEPQT